VSEGLALGGRVGTVLGRKWRIEERLGAGSSAAVYRAQHWNTGRKVAVKVLHADVARSAQSRSRFLREGRLANGVKHAGVVDVIDDGETDDGCPFLIMELLEGETLDQRRKATPGGRLAPREAVNACLAVLDVLAAAHEAGIVHRDVKPQNVFLTKSGQTKLLDFGVAGAAEQRGGTGEGGRGLGSSSSTRTGTGLGTPLFMAPEQITGSRAIDAHADLWGVGATLYFLVAGAFPFERILPAEYVAATRAPPPRLDKIVPGLPTGIADVVERALAFEPSNRWPDARTMFAALARERAGLAATRDASLLAATRDASFLAATRDVSTAARDASLLAATRPEAPVPKDTRPLSLVPLSAGATINDDAVHEAMQRVRAESTGRASAAPFMSTKRMSEAPLLGAQAARAAVESAALPSTMPLGAKYPGAAPARSAAPGPARSSGPPPPQGRASSQPLYGHGSQPSPQHERATPRVTERSSKVAARSSAGVVVAILTLAALAALAVGAYWFGVRAH
jgi:eukaryotic-like serine/threonine-protein kinase